MVSENQAQIKRSVVKIYDLNKAGGAHIKRTWILENLTNKDLVLPFFFVVEETNQILNVKASVEYNRIPKDGFTKIRLKPKPKIGPEEKYEFTVEYDYGDLADRFGDCWVVGDDFTKYEDVNVKFHEDDEYKVKIILPVLKRWWVLWESFKYDSIPDAQSCQEEGRTSLSWQFVLRPKAIQRIRVLYQVRKNEKMTALLAAIGTVIVKEFGTKILQTILGKSIP